MRNLILISLVVALLVLSERLTFAFRGPIVRELIQTINQHTELGAHDISVEEGSGIVTLSGKVCSAADRAAIENLSRRIVGVREVENGIEVDESISNHASETIK